MGEGAAYVLVATRDATVRASVARSLVPSGFPIVEVGRGDEALDIALESRPAAVVLETCLDGADAFVVCQELRDRYGENLPIILVADAPVTTHERVAGLLVGADDYLAEPVSSDELLARLRRELARTRGRNDHRVSGGPPLDSSRPERLTDLTPRELEVLLLLALGRSTAAMARELVISRKTVATHIQHLIAKLGVNSRSQAVARAYESGLVQVGAGVEAHGGVNAPTLVTP